MTFFASRALKIVVRIGKGEVLSYKEVAKRAGRLGTYRAVGNILSKNRDPKIPCHRIIRSDGKIGGYNRGTKAKREILKKKELRFIFE